MSDTQTDDEKLVPLNVMVPQRIKTWIQEEAFAKSSPKRNVKMGEVARELLEEKYREHVSGS